MARRVPWPTRVLGRPVLELAIPWMSFPALEEQISCGFKQPLAKGHHQFHRDSWTANKHQEDLINIVSPAVIGGSPFQGLMESSNGAEASGCSSIGLLVRGELVLHWHGLRPSTIIGWWSGTFFIFPYFGNSNPNWLICFRGVETTHQYYIYLQSFVVIYYDRMFPD